MVLFCQKKTTGAATMPTPAAERTLDAFGKNRDMLELIMLAYPYTFELIFERQVRLATGDTRDNVWVLYTCGPIGKLGGTSKD
jgi:hypothetical protein